MTIIAEMELDNALQRMSHELVPQETYIIKGKQAVIEVFEYLKKTLKLYTVDRVYFGGSIGKKTALSSSDFDPVIFINIPKSEENPPFTNVLEYLDTIFRHPQTKIALPGLQQFSRTRFSFQLIYRGYQIDMVIAANYVKNYKQKPSNPLLASIQAYHSLRKIQENPRQAYYYSSGLVESQLVFMTQQSSFVHDLVRLAKYWNDQIPINTLISGRSTLVELIAVNAAQLEEKSAKTRHPSILRAFKKFLTDFANFSRLQLVFPNFSPLDPLFELKRPNNKKWLSIIDDIDWTWRPKGISIKQNSPSVIEPANPFNNIAENMKGGKRFLFEQFASKVLNRLANFSGHLSKEGGNVIQNLEWLFKFECTSNKVIRSGVRSARRSNKEGERVWHPSYKRNSDNGVEPMEISDDDGENVWHPSYGRTEKLAGNLNLDEVGPLVVTPENGVTEMESQSLEFSNVFQFCPEKLKLMVQKGKFHVTTHLFNEFEGPKDPKVRVNKSKKNFEGLENLPTPQELEKLLEKMREWLGFILRQFVEGSKARNVEREKGEKKWPKELRKINRQADFVIQNCIEEKIGGKEGNGFDDNDWSGKCHSESDAKIWIEYGGFGGEGGRLCVIVSFRF